MPVSLTLTIIIAYFAILLIISRITSRNATASTFFNGDNSSPWYLVAFGTIGASISGVTFVSVPGEVGVNHWYYLMFVLGNFVGYWIIAYGLIPLYYRLRLISIYDYLLQRFGRASHLTGSIFFILSQFIGASFRLFLVIGVLHVLVFDTIGIPFWITSAIALTMIWLYIRQSGIKTIVWTDTLQTISIIVAVALTICSICSGLDISLADMTHQIINDETFGIINNDVSASSHWLKQFISGIAIVIVMNGLDQNIMQKSLTCRNATEAKKNMMTFSFAFLATNILFLALGTMLYIYARQRGIEIPAATDDLFPRVVMEGLPVYVGVIFLTGIIAAAFSSADSSLTALTTVVCIDILRLNPSDEATTQRRKRITIMLAFMMFMTLCLFRLVNDRSVVSAIFTVAGYTYGPLLGLFTFGLFTKRVTNERWIPYICIASPIICYIVNYLSPSLLGYKMGFELILLNGLLVFAGMMITSTRKASE